MRDGGPGRAAICLRAHLFILQTTAEASPCAREGKGHTAKEGGVLPFPGLKGSSQAGNEEGKFSRHWGEGDWGSQEANPSGR